MVPIIIMVLIVSLIIIAVVLILVLVLTRPHTLSTFPVLVPQKHSDWS